MSIKPGELQRGIPNNTFIVRQTCIAASLNSGCRPRLPVGAAGQVIPGSNQIDSEPRCFSAVLYEGQFLVLYVRKGQTAHARQLPRWIHTGNPSHHLGNKALLRARDGGGWQLSSESANLVSAISPRLNGGYFFELIKCVPIVSDVSDPSEFARWREDRLIERKRLSEQVIKSLNAIMEAEIPEAELEKQKLIISAECEALLRVMRERFPRIVMRSFKFAYERDSRFERLGAVLGSAAGMSISTVLPPDFQKAAVWAGVQAGKIAAGIRISEGPTTSKAIARASPFAVVADLQYPGE